MKHSILRAVTLLSLLLILGCSEVQNPTSPTAIAAIPTVTASVGGTSTTASNAQILATPSPTKDVVGSTVTVSWSAISNAVEYQVVFSDGDAEGEKTTATSIVRNGLPNGSYTVKVKAIAASGGGHGGYNSSGFSGDVQFTVAVYTVTGSAGANGIISPASQPVNSGSTTTLTVTPNSGYTASASGCEGSLSGTTYTTGAITANCTVTATFAASPTDNTPPVIAGPVITGTLGNDGWYTSDVTVTWTATDSQSAVTLNGCSVSVTTNTAGTTYSCTASSAGGMATASITIKRDASVPTVTPSLVGTIGNNGWYTSNVSVSFNVTANGPSGLGTLTGCAAVLVSTDGTFSFICTAESGAGLSNSATASGKRDATPPLIVFTGNALTYTVDQTVNITCSATDARSGIATDSCPAVVAGDAYNFNVGVSTFVETATDMAGNSITASTSFTVSVTYASLCTLTTRFVGPNGNANSFCVKLRQGSYGAYVNQVQAQTGKAISAAHAAILIRLVAGL